MSEKKLIIGCGYLGRRVARHWIDRGDEVYALTRSRDHAHALRELGARPILGDVTDAPSLAALPRTETILYAVGLDRAAGRSQREVYVGGLENVVSRLGDEPPQFLYLSSTSVYGQSEGEWVDERSDCRPQAENGRVCLESEQALRRHVPHANILRLAGLYGPGRLVARVEKLRAGVPLEGNPEAWLNLIHVDDAASSVLACERRGAPGETYLVCDDRPVPRREYYRMLARMIGAPEPRCEQPAASIPSLGKRCSNRRLREELQVELHYPTIESGLPAALTPPAPA